MAEAEEVSFQGAIKLLKNVTKVSGNLRNDLKHDILQAISELNKVFSKLHKEIEELKEQKEKSVTILREEPKNGAEVMTYAMAASKPISGKLLEDINTKPSFKMVIKSQSKETTSENMKALIKSKVNPSSLKVGIKNFKSISNGRVLIESHNKEDIIKICAEINNKLGDVANAQISKKLKPRLILYNIPEEVNKDNALTLIQQQNSDVFGENADVSVVHLLELKRIHKRHMVIEVSPTLRKKILDSGVKLMWSLCRARDHVSVLRCFNCCRYGHHSRDCKNELTCSNCSENHSHRDCQVKQENFTCTNCVNHNKYTNRNALNYNTNHCSMSKLCPSFLDRIKARCKNIEYNVD